MLEKSRLNKQRIPAFLVLLALAPFQLAAKGCDVATVGEEGCVDGEVCEGEEQACGGLTGAGCGDGHFCDYAPDALCGAADATGVCAPLPEGCLTIYLPVCGCDDRTYGNACEANMAGVSVASEGECAPSSVACGGSSGAGCDDGEFCAYPADARCGTANQAGVCAPKPDACDAVYDPVCGCDGKTYGNACEANMAGVSVASEGECGTTPPDDGEVCGGLSNLPCASGEFCAYAPGSCGAGDESGICTPTPVACDANYDPVCGCDDETYGNECEANMAGVSTAHAGPCEDGTPGQICGGLTGAACPADQYCNYSEEADCGAGDVTGVCTDQPEGCTADFVPVCGCDGKTYSNACTAAAEGVSVDAPGECP